MKDRFSFARGTAEILFVLPRSFFAAADFL